MHRDLVKYFIGRYLDVYIAWALDEKLRFDSASGGVATALLKYLLERGLVEATVLPRSIMKRGVVYGLWTIVTEPSELGKYSGSIYAPTVGLKVLAHALKKYRRLAVTALPCQSRAVRKLLRRWDRKEDVIIIGLYCNNTPSSLATSYALRFFGFPEEDVEKLFYRGHGWPGCTTIKVSDRLIYIPFLLFFDSGFGQYFYGRACYLCSDHTNVDADVALADPWTLPQERFSKIGGATLVVIRSERGLKVFEGAVEMGYIAAEKVDPVYAVQDTTLLKASRRVFAGGSTEVKLPPGFTTVAYELTYLVGHVLASRERLWRLLQLYHKVVRSPILMLTSLLDSILGTRWGRLSKNIKLLQRLKASELRH